MELGELRSEAAQRRRDKLALDELQETLGALHAELKVCVPESKRTCAYKQELDVAAGSAEAPWREKNDELNRLRTERQNAENDASMQVGIYQSSLSELEGKHRACQACVILPRYGSTRADQQLHR